MDHELRLEALRIAQAQLPPSTPVDELIREAGKVLNWLRGEVAVSSAELFQRARQKAIKADGFIPLG